MQFKLGFDMYVDSVFSTFNVCKLNSRVGERMTAAADMDDALLDDDVDCCDLRLCECRYFSNKGIQNAAVLPEPVLAITTVSFPDKITGRDFLCTGVGTFLTK